MMRRHCCSIWHMCPHQTAVALSVQKLNPISKNISTTSNKLAIIGVNFPADFWSNQNANYPFVFLSRAAKDRYMAGAVRDLRVQPAGLYGCVGGRVLTWRCRPPRDARGGLRSCP
eukprot:scaffold219769_cov37-Prasinocladus_malaysianus.AAC.1